MAGHVPAIFVSGFGAGHGVVVDGRLRGHDVGEG
jgi:hypothetical protein